MKDQETNTTIPFAGIMALLSISTFRTFQSKARTTKSISSPTHSLVPQEGQLGTLSLPRNLSNFLLQFIPLHSTRGLQGFYVQVTQGYLPRSSPLLAQHSFRLLLEPSPFSGSKAVPTRLYTHWALPLAGCLLFTPRVSRLVRG